MKIIKIAGLWISGILFFSEILGAILVSIGSLIIFVREFLDNSIILNSYIAGNLLSQIFLIICLVIGIVFLSQLFNNHTKLDLASYKWVYSMSVFIFLGILTLYISNDKSIEKIMLFQSDLIIMFVSLTLIFFFQKVYKDIAEWEYSYILFIGLSCVTYLYYLFQMAPIWEYHRVIFWIS